MDISKKSFDSWLKEKLLALEIDDSVFGSYIEGILEGDETEDEKTEALKSLLDGILEDNISKHVDEILAAWAKWHSIKTDPDPVGPPEDVVSRLSRMLELQSIPTTTQKSYTEEERRIRAAILAQYSEMSVGQQSDDEDEENGVNGDCAGIEKNKNAATIVQQEKEKREKAKLDSQKKKEKDKEDREKQKQLKEDKKEKRKTQKGERRR